MFLLFYIMDLRKEELTQGEDQWTTETIQIIRTWRVQALSRGTAHEQAMMLNKKYDKIITLPIVVFSAILGSSGVTTIAKNQESTKVHQIWTSIIGIIIAALTALKTTFQFEVKANQHQLASKNYLRISRLIDVQLTRALSDREDSKTLIDRLVFALDNLRETSPDIEEKILRHFPSIVENFDNDVSTQYPVINFAATISKKNTFKAHTLLSAKSDSSRVPHNSQDRVL